MKTIYILILSLLVLTLIVGCSDKNQIEQEIVGNDKDEYGCIGSAGYQYCPELEKCVRTWEEPCPSLQQQNKSSEELAINLSTPYLITKPMYKDNNGRLLKVEEVVLMRCQGCFSVYFNFLIDNTNNEIEKITARVDINNWEPTIADFTRSEPVIITKTECIYYKYGKVLENCINQTSIASVGNMRCCI